VPLRIAALVVLPACLVQEIDLRSPTDPQPLVETCPANQRFVSGSGCVDCVTMEDPLLTCPCAWAYYQPGPLPYCDAPEAYYVCLPCSGDIDTCNAYDATSGTSQDCFLLESCCDQLAADPGSTPCCEEPDLLRCVIDPAGASGERLVGCQPPDCCQGDPCPGGPPDCEPWQSCSAGTCTPACHPTLEVCDVIASGGGLACVCNEVIAP
jgi:hypothetical protein